MEMQGFPKLQNFPSSKQVLEVVDSEVQQWGDVAKIFFLGFVVYWALKNILPWPTE